MKGKKKFMPVLVREYEFHKSTYVFLAFMFLFGFYGSCKTDNWTQLFHDACKSAHTDSEISLPLVVTQEYLLRGYEYIWGHPVISGDYILITGFRVLEYPIGFYSDAYSTNKVHCFSVESGEEIWTLDIGDVDETPLISGNIVLVPADTLQCRDSLVVGSGSKAFVLGHLKEEPEEQSPPLELSIPTVCAVLLICFILIFVLIWGYRHLSQ